MPPDTSPGAFTAVRWRVLLLICLMYLITFMDRANISIAAPDMLQEFGISKSAMGVVFSAFLWAYSLGQIPGGWVGDRFGPRRVLAVLVALWSVMTVATGIVTGLVSLVAVRFIFGLGEAGAFPTATRAMQTWFPRGERGLAQGLTHSFARLGIAVVPPLAVALIAQFGWRSVFYVFGGAGLLWTAAFLLTYRDLPEQHPRMTAAELSVIRDQQPAPVAAARATPPWRAILRLPTLWYASLAWACYNYCIFFYFTWFPTYLADHLHIAKAAIGWVASLPLLAGVAGDVLGGIFTDLILKRTGRLRLARAVIAAPAMALSGVALVLAAMAHDPVVIVFWLAVSLFCLELVIGPAWALSMDIGGAASGTVSGIINMVGNLGGSLSPVVFGILAQYGAWTAPFYISAAVMVAGSLLWTFLINPEARPPQHG